MLNIDKTQTARKYVFKQSDNLEFPVFLREVWHYCGLILLNNFGAEYGKNQNDVTICIFH